MTGSGIFLPSNALGAFADAFRDSCAMHLSRAANGFTEASDQIRAQTVDSRIRTRMGDGPRLDITRHDFLEEVRASAAAFEEMSNATFSLQRLAQAHETPVMRHLIQLDQEVADPARRWVDLQRTPALATGLQRAWTLDVNGTPTLHWGEIVAIDANTREIAFRHIRRETGYGHGPVSGLCLVLADELVPLPTHLL